MTTPDLPVGLSAETSYLVEREQTAPHLGSGDVAVYATPAMAALAESLCADSVQGHLGEGQSTVGVFLEVHHLAPTPVGQRVHARATLEAVEDDRLTFNVEIWDEQEVIGRIRHRRVVIDVARFLKRVEAKRARSS